MAGSETSSPVSTEAILPTPTRRPLAETLIRAGGIIVAVVLAAGSALLEILYTSAYFAGAHRAPWSVIGAIVGNIFLVYFARATIATRWAPAVPALVWIVVMLVGTYRTREGDMLMLDNNPVALATLVAGFVALVVAWYAPQIRKRR